jgi:Flp pilus assembly protein TadG
VRASARSRTRSRQPRRGAAAAELAIILPLLVTIVLGCVDFGRFAYNYIALTNAARAAAEYAMMNNYSPSTYNTWVSNATTAAQQEMTGQIGYSSSSLTVSSPTVTTESSGLKRAQFTVSYPFQTVVNWSYLGLAIPNTTTMQRTIVIRLIR